MAVEGYRDGTLTRDQVGRLLGLSYWETEAFLKERQAYLAYTEENFEQDRRNLDRLVLPAIPDASRPGNQGLLEWLLACPEKGFFVPIEPESTDTL